jgi:hypothetical protein
MESRMLTITFLGHQGWLVSAGGTHVMIDPILSDEFGAIADAGLKVFPPRCLTLESAPPISAIFISHEHDDHFHIKSLNCLDRKIPVFLSARSSNAAKVALETMGFRAMRVEADVAVKIGQIELRTFSPDLYGHYSDEWDVLPFFVRDTKDGGGFFSPVDVSAPREAVRRVSSVLRRPLVTFANNHTSNHALTNWKPAPPPHTGVVRQISLSHETYQEWAMLPAAHVLCGGGWSFTGDIDWLNRAFFPSDSQRVAKAFDAMSSPGAVDVSAPLPGQSFLVTASSCRAAGLAFEDFIRPAAANSWPDRTYDPKLPRAEILAPLLPPDGTSSLTAEDLRRELEMLARGLVGTHMFRALASLQPEELGNARRVYSLFAQTAKDGSGYLFEYDPIDCEFVVATGEPEDYAAGMACWAADLWALLRGELNPPAFTMGHVFEWVRCRSAKPEALAISSEFWKLFHPLRRPRETLAFYRECVTRSREGGPRVPGA